MPAGIPAGTLAVGKAGAINSAIMATSTCNKYPEYREAVQQLRNEQAMKVLENAEIKG